MSTSTKDSQPTPTHLVAVDMDGTLLDGDGKLPPEFPELLAHLRQRGVLLAPASGRQLATLKNMFDPFGMQLPLIAENGTVVHDGHAIVSTTAMSDDTVHAVIDAINEHNQREQAQATSTQEFADRRLNLVVCRPECAFVDSLADIPGAAPARTGTTLAQEIEKYYNEHAVVADLHEVVNGEIIKLAIFSSTDAEGIAAPLAFATAPNDAVAVSGQHWVDIMHPEANKGHALVALAKDLGIAQENTYGFGDYLNDLELLKSAGTAYAMENAHQKLKDIADHIAPANTDNGVARVLYELFP